MSIDFLSDLVITGVRSVSTLYNSKNNGAKRCDRPCWAIIVKYEGETVYTSGKKRFVSDLSHIALLPRGCSYEWRCTESGHFCALEFESEATYHEPIIFAVKNGEKILKMLKDLEYQRNIKKPVSNIESIRDVYSILLALIHSSEAQYLPTDKQAKITPALEYISEHYNEKITNEKLASVSNLSVVYFRKLFKNQYGVSPLKYLNSLRLKNAISLMKLPFLSLEECAVQSGFSSLQYFCRLFKKELGISPGKYRLQILG